MIAGYIGLLRTKASTAVKTRGNTDICWTFADTTVPAVTQTKYSNLPIFNNK